jgi:hypothetical protein
MDTYPRMHTGIRAIPHMHTGIFQSLTVCIRDIYGKYFHTRNQVLYPHMRNFAYRDRRMHMGIPVCKRAGIAKNFAYGDPITHNEVVRIRGLTFLHGQKCHTYSK